jgi:hypothetical protein
MATDGRSEPDPEYDDPDNYGERESYYGDGRYPPDWKARTKAVFRRDDYTCQSCGEKSGPHAGEEGAELLAHHEAPLAKGRSNRLDNLETLCVECHEREHDHPIGFDVGGRRDGPEPRPARSITLLSSEYVPVSRQRRIEVLLRDSVLAKRHDAEAHRVGGHDIRVVDTSPRARHVRPVVVADETTVWWARSDDHPRSGDGDTTPDVDGSPSSETEGTDGSKRETTDERGTTSDDGSTLIERLLPWR